MGKTKPRRKYGGERLQPTGLVSEAAMDGDDCVLPNGTSIVSLIEQLQSPECECRLVACTTVATLVADPDIIPSLMQHDVVRILGPLIVDPNLYIQNSAVGALRNLTVDGGFSVCKKMVERDVMTSLVALFSKYDVDWEPEKLCKEKAGDVMVDTYFQAVNLLWNLCENSDTAVCIFNKEKLVIPLVRCLRPDVYGYPLVLAIANCFHVVSENNPEICQFLKGPEPMEMIKNLISAQIERMDALLLRTLCAGLLVNIHGSELTQSAVSFSTAVLSTVAEALQLNTQALLTQAAEKIIAVQANGKSAENDFADKPNEVKAVIDEMENLLRSQQIAVEIAANLCCTDDDEIEEADSEESISSADEMVCDVDMETENGASLSPCCLPEEIHQAFVKFNILHHVLNKIECPELPADNQLLVTDDKLKKGVHQLRVHALFTLANIISTLDLEAIGGPQCLYDICHGLVKLGGLHTGSDLDLEYVEAVSSALRAVVQKIAESKMTKFSELMSTESMSMFEMMRYCPRHEIRVNAVRILSSIGSALLSTPEAYKDLKPIGLALVSMASQDKDLHVVAEALDAIFDIFAEDNVNPIMNEIGLLDQLRKVLVALKPQATASREAKRKFKDPVISTAKLNLVRFIQYKSNVTTQHTAMSCDK